MRRRLLVGNWKMHKTATEASVFVHDLASLIAQRPWSVDVVLAPPFTALAAVAQALSQVPSMRLGAQNLFWEDKGAYTGEISGPMLTDLRCQYVILGHSERRQHFGETDSWINQKLKAALRHGLHPILCIGESLAQRESGAIETHITTQLNQALTGISAHEGRTVAVAYEPIWAIGTGRAATPDQAVEVHRAVRTLLHQQWGPEVGAAIRILYGGSVTPENAKGFLERPEIDGALVGGACLDPRSFATILSLAESSVR